MRFTLFLLVAFLFYGSISAQQLQYQNHEMEYDDLNRLTKVFFSNGIVHEYVYDNLGNRLERLVYEAPKTYVPDDAFEQHLIDEGYDLVMDDYVYTHKIDDIEELFMNGLGIADLTGVEDFEALENLSCSNNNLTSIDVSANTNLQQLWCSHNNLTSLDITTLNDLFILDCGNNDIPNLDLTNNLLLQHIGIGSTLIETVDLSNHSEVTWFEAINGQLTSLNLENGNNNAITYMHAGNNPNLFCIQVDDEDDANASIGVYADWQTDAQIQYSYNCNLTYVPDDAFEQRLIDLGYDVVLNDYVVTAEIDDVTFLSATSLGIQDATGIEDFTAIEILYFNYNNIETIDLSQNTQLRVFQIGENNLTSVNVTNNTLLESLTIGDNQLTSLDITNNPDLFFLSCDNNQLTELDISNSINLGLLNAHYNNISNLDVSQNSNLSYLWIRNNPIESLDFSNNPNLDELNARNCEQLTTLNLKNGNNTILDTVLTQNSPNLYCIQVDDEDAANNGAGVYGNWNTDAQVQFSEDCEALGLNEFGLPFDNYTISTVGLTCINSSDGVINIKAETERDYTVQIVSDGNGVNDFFVLRASNNWEIYEDYFEGGEYFVYITLDGISEDDYKKTFILNLDEPEPLEVASRVASSQAGRFTVEMTKGTAPFTIKLNNEIIGTTNNSEFSFDASHGDVVEVTTSKSCEGKFTETLSVLDAIVLHPNPTSDKVYFSIPVIENTTALEIQLFDVNGRLVGEFVSTITNQQIEISIQHLPTRVYLAKFPSLGEKTFKIIKE